MYKILLILAVLNVASSKPLFGLPTITDFVDNIGRNFYNFGFKTSDGTTRKESGKLINEGTPDEEFVVNGESSWISPEGIRYDTIYEADKNGYRANVMKMDKQEASVRSDFGSEAEKRTRIGSGTTAALVGKK